VSKALADKHVHKYRRLKYKSGNMIFFCALPDCNQKINISLALGKRSICWRCGEPFVMTEYSLRLAKPHCENCHRPKNLPDEVIVEPSPAFSPIASLAERLQQTIKQAKEEQDEEI
jgi:hypothetical protein